jgi:hypothetical protein
VPPPTDTRGMEIGQGPLHSRYDDDPTYTEAIDAFIVRLAERVDGLQDIEARGDMTGLADAVTSLGNQANHLGYPLLAEMAGEVAQAARDRNGDLARKALEDLTEVSRRMRQAHRGSL